MNRSRAVALTVVLLLTACPGPSGGDGGQAGGSVSAGGGTGGNTGGGTGGSAGGAGPLPLAQICSEVSTAICQAIVRCGALSDAGNCSHLFDFGADCLATQLGAIDAGRIGYDGVQARACLAAISGGACESFLFSNDASCIATFPGRVMPGGFCTSENECTAGNFCRRHPLACGGTCTAKLAEGQVTMNDEVCADGTVVHEGVCTRPTLMQGERCGNPDGGFIGLPCVAPASCDPSSRICSAGSARVGEPCVDRDAGVSGCGGYATCERTTGRCVTRRGVGEPCSTFGAECLLDLWCNTGVVPARCEALSPTGGACLGSSACADGQCDGGRFNPDGGPAFLGSCLPLPTLGQPCLGRCAAGLACERATDRCVALKADGLDCGSLEECLARACTLRDGGAYTCGSCP